MSELNRSWIDNKWFREENLEWEGYSQSLQIEEILYHQKSKFQDILVFKSKAFGNVLVLDGAIQCTERDEFTYQEMITHLPMNLHSNPEKVLVIGGGDGGVVREVLKYSSVKEVILCEIDEDVIEVSKKFLPNMACCLGDSRVNIQVRDGKEFVRNHQDEFDVIITDAPDPEGEAKGLFEKSYYKDLKDALRKDGVACCQGEVTFLDIEFVHDVITQCRTAFPNVGYAMGNTPTYISGVMGYMLASPSKELNLSKPVRRLTDSDIEKMQLKYYNSDIHNAAFKVPTYVRKALKGLIDT